ncbi:aldehyde dehydrogenase family protein [Lysinibacillus sp. 3P01SB]|uniref:aldehyde dehydrogenase family protein n=1 Tax=Lysinibacillus sp. 3P01SB TaxID=3132284 RepID=UPI0039A5E2A9
MSTYTQLNKNYINGHWVDGLSDRTFDITNPFDEEVLATVKLATLSQVEEAFDIAHTSYRAWAKDAELRRDVMTKAIAYFEEHREEIIELLIIESGSSFIKASVETANTIAVLKEALTMVDRVYEVRTEPSVIPGKINEMHRLPLGVVSSIAPFNFPLYLSMRTIAPALALGNAVVHKADLQVSLASGSVIAKAFEEAGIPAGVFQSILTKSSIIGDVMVEHPVVRLVSFTGSTEVGRRIGNIAGGLFKRVALELGGNGPFVVLADADVDQAVKAAVFGKFLHQGQICMITNRMIVHENLYDEFVEKFVEHVKRIPCGDPRDHKVIIGPIINNQQVKKIEEIINKAKAENTEILLEGKVVGNVITPTIFGNVSNDSDLAQNEIFGPVAPIIKASSDEEAIRFANDTIYGLSSAIFSGNEEKAREYALEIEFGMTHINDQTVNDETRAAFGGMRQSGVGRFGNPWIVDEFTDTKWISVQKVPREYPF